MSGEITPDKKPRLQTDHQSNCSVLNLVDLPEHLLTHIFSLLPAKDVVRTSVLSTEWEYKWASAHHIEIDEKHRIVPTRATKGSFYNFVDRILLHCLNIQNFQLSCERMSDPRRLKSWISTLSRRDVQSINIVTRNYKNFFLPSCLFDNTSLTKLSLVLNCIIKVPINDCLGNLKYLFLSGIHFLIEHFSEADRLILNFRVLESLELNHCTWGDVKFVEITAPALTTFNYVTKPGEYGYLIKVIGARLEKYRVDGVILDNFELNAKSVVHASFRNFSRGGDHPFIAKSRSHARISINEFASLEYLRISGQISKGYAALKPGLPLPKFGKLETLEMSVCKVEALMEFLRMAPNLKLLIIDMFVQDLYDTEVYNYEGIGYVPYCMMSHLAEIKCLNFMGLSPQFHMVDFLLKNSVKLEKFLVFVYHEPVLSKAEMERLLPMYPGGCISLVFPEERK